jgi:hypothetical protein
MYTLSRTRTTIAVALATAVGVAGTNAILVDSAVAKSKTRHCVKYKAVKTKAGKKVKRCAKYSK